MLLCVCAALQHEAAEAQEAMQRSKQDRESKARVPAAVTNAAAAVAAGQREAPRTERSLLHGFSAASEISQLRASDFAPLGKYHPYLQASTDGLVSDSLCSQYGMHDLTLPFQTYLLDGVSFPPKALSKKVTDQLPGELMLQQW